MYGRKMWSRSPLPESFGCPRPVSWRGLGETMREWISVKDRLPEPGENVLTHDPGLVRGFDINRIGERTGRWVTSYSSITHWMPLPPPPVPKLTAKEALREAVGILCLMANRECGGTQWTQAEISNAMGRIPRLRAALEGEE